MTIQDEPCLINDRKGNNGAAFNETNKNYHERIKTQHPAINGIKKSRRTVSGRDYKMSFYRIICSKQRGYLH